MKSLEEIAYDAGRHALADQETLVTGIQQRTGALVAAHAVVASFLGSTTLTARGLGGWGWIALVALVAGLVVAAILLAPWKFRFALDVTKFSDNFLAVASAEARADNRSWLIEAVRGYEALRERNAAKVRRMSRMASSLGALMIVQTLAWFVDLIR